MEVATYRLTPKGLESIDRDKVAEAQRSGDGAYWIDTVGSSTKWREGVLANIDATSFLRRAVHDHPDIGSVVSTGQAVYFQVASLGVDRETPIVYLHGLVVDNALVTWRNREIQGIDDLTDALKTPSDMPWVTSVSNLVAALCVQLANDAYREGEELRRRMDTISKEATANGEFNEKDLSSADADLRLTDEVAGDYIQVFKSLRDSNSDAIDLGGKHSHIHIAINTSEALARRVRGYYDALREMHRTQDRWADDKSNRRLGLLSVVSAIFLPLTLLTGIFGMNFEHMPSLSWSWAYPVLLILMVVIGAGMWRYFKRSGWI